jgi:hypothetical protein
MDLYRASGDSSSLYHANVLSAANALMDMPGVTRADGTVADRTVERVLVERHLKARADALGFDLTTPRGKRWLTGCKELFLGPSTRADGAYYDGTLRTMYSGSILMEPTQDRADILSGVPVRTVTPGAKTYALRTAQVSGKAVRVNAEATSYPRPGYNLGESGGSLAFYAFEIPDHWLVSMYQDFAALDVAMMNMQALRTAFVEAEYDTRLNGDGALLGLSQLGIPELTGSATYVGGTAIATLVDDFIGMVDTAKVGSAAGAAYDTMIIADRVWYAMDRSTNLGSGGDTNAQEQIEMKLRRRGINRVIVGKSLKDYGGTNVDAALLFQTNAEFGLAQVRQMNAAPVHTYTSANGTNTVHAASWGGCECPLLDSALLLKLPAAA